MCATYKKLCFTAALFIALFVSCENTVINYNRLNNLSVDDTSKNKVRVNFNTIIEQNFTRAGYENIGKNKYINVYDYDTDNNLVTIVNYISTDEGTLSPLTEAMYLPPGTYNFFAVGTNDFLRKIPSFTNGICSDIDYTVDYIWSDTCNVTLKDLVNNYNLKFDHSVTQVALEIVISEEIDLVTFEEMFLTPSSRDTITWNLFNGDMGPSHSVNDTLFQPLTSQLNDTTFYGTFTMPALHLKESSTLKASFKIIMIIDENQYSRAYQTELPIMNDSLKVGYSYHYSLLIRADTILFNSVNIDNWIPVVDNVPIAPDID